MSKEKPLLTDKSLLNHFYMKHQAKILRKYRTRAGLSQKAIAEHFGLNSSQFISNCERSVSPIPIKMMKPLSKLLDIPLEKLIQAYALDFKDKLLEKIANVS